MSLPTGSKLELAERCIASAVLESVETTSEAADLGTVKHDLAFDVLQMGRPAALARVPSQYREKMERFDTDGLPHGQPGSWAGEVAFAADVVTGKKREIGRNIGREYAKHGAGPNDIAGAIDIVGMSPEGAAIVVDMKTGWTRVTKAKENLQLLFAAVCAAEVYGTDTVKGAIMYVNEDGQPYFDTAEWDAVDLAAGGLRIDGIGQAVLEAQRLYAGDPKTGEVVQPRMTAGDHCKWCPALLTCPAQSMLVRRFISTPVETEADFRMGLAENDVAAYAYERLTAAKAAVERALAVVYARASASPIALRNGMVLGKVESEREYLDAAVVHRVVVSQFGPEAAAQAVEMEATKASIERMARALRESKGGTIKKHKDAVLDAVRALDGVKVKVVSSVKEFKPKPLALPEGTKS